VNPLTLAAPALANATPLELVNAAAAAGFAGVGLRIAPSRVRDQPFHPVVGQPPLIADIRRRLADGPLQVLELYSFYLTPDFDFAAFHAAMEVGAELGARYAVVLGYDSNRSRACETFARMCDIAAQFGVTAAVEFAPVADCRPATLSEALQLLREAGRPNSAIMPDPAHLFRSGGTEHDLRIIPPAALRFSQICDFQVTGEELLATVGRPVPKLRRCPLGEGVLRVNEWMDALPRDIPVSVECVPQPAGLSHTEWARVLYSSTRAALEKYYDTPNTAVDVRS
jgi:sugar phosphate isomerase/epimerase